LLDCGKNNGITDLAPARILATVLGAAILARTAALLRLLGRLLLAAALGTTATAIESGGGFACVCACGFGGDLGCFGVGFWGWGSAYDGWGSAYDGWGVGCVSDFG
jgi:hypothetical protein